MTDHEIDGEPGAGLVAWSWRSTIALVVLLSLGVAFTGTLGPLVAGVSLLMFFVGLAMMAMAYAVGVRRSRRELVTVPGLFLLQGTAPREVRRSMLWSVTVQSLVAIAAAVLRLYTLIAFGILAPTFAFGLAAIWAARHGTFAPRDQPGGMAE